MVLRIIAAMACSSRFGEEPAQNDDVLRPAYKSVATPQSNATTDQLANVALVMLILASGGMPTDPALGMMGDAATQLLAREMLALLVNAQWPMGPTNGRAAHHSTDVPRHTYGALELLFITTVQVPINVFSWRPIVCTSSSTDKNLIVLDPHLQEARTNTNSMPESPGS